MDIIKSKDNTKIKYVRNLNGKKFREEEGAFLVEGVKLINEAIEENADIKLLLLREDVVNKNEVAGITQLIDESKIFICKSQVFNSITDTVNSQGILAVINKAKYSREKVLNEYKFIILCDRLQDPGNLGTVLRIADAFGPAALALNKGCADLFNPKVVRASAGAIFRVPIIYDESDLISQMKEEGFYIVSTVVDSEYSFDHIEKREKICIVIGNEGQGVSQEILDASHMKITIKMPGRAESLNVSVAAGISIYEMRKKLL